MRPEYSEAPDHFLFFVFTERDPSENSHRCWEPEDTGRRTIFIYRDESPYEGLDALKEKGEHRSTQELVMVAHELGHHLRWLGCKLPNTVDRRKERVFSPVEARSIYSEEVVAWAIGKQLLMECKFEKWDSFDEERECCLRTYQDGLGLDGQESKEIESGLGAMIEGIGPDIRKKIEAIEPNLLASVAKDCSTPT
jgi:hypothetical protein